MQRLHKHIYAKMHGYTSIHMHMITSSIPMLRLHQHTYAKITQAYICKDYASSTYAKIAGSYICKDHTSTHMQ